MARPDQESEDPSSSEGDPTTDEQKFIREARMDIYKLVVEMADRMTARRAGANSYFLTVNATLATLVGLFGSSKNGDSVRFERWGILVGATAGVVLSLTWWALLRYYRRLSGAKFDVINEIETRLPESPYTSEWRKLHPDEQLPIDVASGKAGKKKRPFRHREATVVEQVVPWVFVVIFALLGAKAGWWS